MPSTGNLLKYFTKAVECDTKLELMTKDGPMDDYESYKTECFTDLRELIVPTLRRMLSMSSLIDY